MNNLNVTLHEKYIIKLFEGDLWQISTGKKSLVLAYSMTIGLF